MSEYDSFTFEHDGRTFRAALHYDSDPDAPWDAEDGHGPVSDWTRRDKQAGELVLCADRGSRRFYDFAEATRIAKRDGWGLCDADIATLATRLGRKPSRKEIIREAVMRDYDYLRRWYAGDWHYCGVVVTSEDSDAEASLWGVESDCEDYIREVACDLAAEILAEERKTDAALNAAMLSIATAATGTDKGV